MVAGEVLVVILISKDINVLERAAAGEAAELLLLLNELLLSAAPVGGRHSGSSVPIGSFPPSLIKGLTNPTSWGVSAMVL